MKTVLNDANQLAAEVTALPKRVQAVSIKVETTANALRFQKAIDAELKVSGTRRVLVDARQAPLSTKEMNDSMWSWVRANLHFDRLAIVNQSPGITVAAKMRAKAIGSKKVGVFHSIQDAAHWLVAAR